jgi:hypothetical protein
MLANVMGDNKAECRRAAARQSQKLALKQQLHKHLEQCPLRNEAEETQRSMESCKVLTRVTSCIHVAVAPPLLLATVSVTAPKPAR